jgi:hypothetical protein
VNALLAEDYTVYLWGPPYNTLGDTWNGQIVDERGALASIANGTTVFWMDDGVNALVASSYADGQTPMLSDGVHYTVAGGGRAADSMYQALDAVLFPNAGGDGGVFMLGSNMTYNKAVDITKSDSVNIVGPKPLTDAVFVGGAGIVVAVWQDDTTSQFTAVAGEILPFAIKRVNDGSTTATLLKALYQI